MKILPLVPFLLLITCTLPESAIEAHAVPASAPRVQGEDAALRRRAEELEEQGSWELARREWQKLVVQARDAQSKRWAEYRAADCAWRSLASTQQPDDTEIQAARAALEALQKPVDRPELRDATWARVEESLGDFFWTNQRRMDWGQAWQHYSNALEWWAGAKDVETARARYLGMVYRMAWPHDHERRNAWYAGQIPLQVHENAVAIAKDPIDRARTLFLFATSVQRQGGDLHRTRRGQAALERAIELGKGTPWYDEALFTLASWVEAPGVPDVDEEGRWGWHPDYVKALGLYRRYTEEFEKGRAPQWDEARAAIERITRIEVSLAVGSAFLPGSEAGYTLAWRNARQVDLALYRMDLTAAGTLDFARSSDQAGAWLGHVQTGALERVREWRFDTKDAGRHVPGQQEQALEPALPDGAYLLEARVDGRSARELVLVGRTLAVIKASSGKAVVWCCDALTSEPLAKAKVVVWEHHPEQDTWVWRKHEGTTGADGTFALATRETNGHEELLVFASAGDRQAFASTASPDPEAEHEAWRIYAVTDRPAYRPEDTVQWKVTARVRREGRYSTPAGAKLAYEITDPRGASVKKGELALNAFGSAWTELPLSASMPLGEYHVRFDAVTARGTDHAGSATLFRLEEYKLPEFEVTIRAGEDDGKPKLYRLGDRVEAELEARTYFGAPVASAEVVVTVFQRPWYRQWRPKREFPWFYAESNDWRWGRWNQGAQIQHITSKTDAQGKLKIAFDTPADQGQDFEYSIQARVVDASRREIQATGTVRVAKQAYAVEIELPHKLRRPGETVEALFKARDANDQPVASAEGRLKLERRRWVEVWIDAQGKELAGSGLALARSADPALPLEHRPGWRLKKSGYEAEEVAATVVKTDAKGEARWIVPVSADGFYTVRWGSRDDRRQPIQAEDSFWVASEGTQDTGYRSGPVEIVLDRDTFKLGEKAPLILQTATANRWVLFTVESQRLVSHQVVHVTGTAKLVELAIGEEHLPNVWLSAYTAVAGEAAADMKEVVVPPTPQFLTVDVTPDAAEYVPGGKGMLAVVTKDARGEPVSAEVTLALVDESVLSLQAEYAGDPRPFFHGRRNDHRVATGSTLDHKRYRRLVKDKRGNLQDERQAYNEPVDSVRELEEGWDESGGVTGGGGKKETRMKLGAAASAPSGRAGGLRDQAAPAMEMLSSLEKNDRSDDAKRFRQEDKDGGAAGGEGSEPVVHVRSDFRETALWKPDLVTDASGRASIEVRYPESLTRWKASARAATADTRVGWASATTRTKKPLTARLQAPRFFVVGDECVVSALVDNQSGAEQRVKAELGLTGLEVAAAPPAEVVVAAGGQTRFDWKVRATQAGLAKIVLTARAGALSDGMTKTYPVHAHGIDAQVARALRLIDGELAFTLDVPAARRKETTRMELQVAPSLAVTMLDALPYLVDYPYGCTEQTMSRFLPAAIVAKTLKDRGLSPEEAMTRVFGGIERETADNTHPRGKKSLELLTEITRMSLERLHDYQHGDGGWGWWKPGDSDHWMTAYVVWGLSLARDAGLDVDQGRLARGVEYLKKELVEEEDSLELQAWMLHAIACWSKDARESDVVDAAIKNLWEKKDALNAYGRALYALACQGFGRTDRAKVMADNLLNGATIDATPDVSRIEPGSSTRHAATMKTAHWGNDGIWWRWSDSNVESTAFALRALMAIDPKHELVEPVMAWLVQNRRGAQWSNTRDTAITVLALNDYLAKSGELARDVEYEVVVNGKSLGRTKVAAKDLLTAPGRFTVEAKDVKDGANEVRVRIVGGKGPLYVSARATFFSLEEPIPPRGSQIFAKRQYYELESRPTLLKGTTYEKKPLEDGGTVASGDRIEVVLTIEAKNNLEYLLFEDLKPAGFEAVETQSGQWMSARELKSGEVAYRFEGSGALAAVPDPDDWTRYTGRQRGVHQELRDRKVAFFVDKLDQGVWELRYTLRAEVPGRFHALPVLGEAMYVPEIRCNGAETRVTVEERVTSGG